MQLHHHIQEETDSYRGNDTLSEYDIEKIPDKVEWAAYWYHSAQYEGYGNILMRAEGQWYIHNLGHCSCYGPMEECELREGFATLEKMRAGGSEEFNKELEGLFKIAEEKLNEWK